jgi:putative transposase
MTNHVHLLITPHFTDSISRILQHIGRQYVCYVNKTYRRSGTLWEGRHKGSLIDAENYLLSCYRYIELNPVAAGMVGKPDPLITPHEVYSRLDSSDAVRWSHYRELFMVNIYEYDLHNIRECLAANQVLGQSRFKDQIEMALDRRLGYLKRGRPRSENAVVN